MSDLFIAAGGGGDPIGTAITAIAMSALLTTAGPGGAHGTAGPDLPVVATYSWERPEVDPTPGPLGVRDFTGLLDRPEGHVLTPAARAVAPAGSTLPRLAADLPVRLVLLDPYEGLAGLAARIRRLAEACGPGRVRIVDVGGDILTHGDEDTLCSPLVDALVLAACTLADVDATVHIAGPGTDGEIPQDVLLDRLDRLDRLAGTDDRSAPTPGHAQAAYRALAWHPSEASALFAAAVLGVRGTVRTVGRAIPLTDASAYVRNTGLEAAVAENPVARGLLESRPRTVDEAADLSAQLTGIHEIARERRPTAPPTPSAAPFPADAHRARERIRAQAGDVSHVTSRFATRALGLPWQRIPEVRTLLGDDGPVHALH
ncbi:DUF1152 domain-containing protein [Streptomyces sp. NBC_01352]|uniref:DUF1152 domain-containing protein n=1 Tax=unclassified Streptomyces TaxID=2593676 RepID=UPI00224CC63A|nr:MULTISPECIES: DUF1152 domain-containing protein [unclassified Streptomyces]MCX4697195.1 DUF1152 domain-containing protein [Streptomyces sp. NBC_01373]